jgi:hypothetical protein
VLPTSCAISRVVPFLVLIRTAEAAGLWASATLGVVPVEALSALDGFRLGFDNCSYNSCSKDP